MPSTLANVPKNVSLASSAFAGTSTIHYNTTSCAVDSSKFPAVALSTAVDTHSEQVFTLSTAVESPSAPVVALSTAVESPSTLVVALSTGVVIVNADIV